MVGQVPRILNPVVLVVDALPELCREPKLNAYVCSLYGSAEGARCGLAAAPAAGHNCFIRRMFWHVSGTGSEVATLVHSNIHRGLVLRTS